MAIDTFGKWWVGTEAEDLREYLNVYTKDEYQTDEFRLAKCQCGSLDFSLEAADQEGSAKRKCVKCSKEHFICDSEEYWEDENPDIWECIECSSKSSNIGVGFSLYKDKGAIRWLYLCGREMFEMWDTWLFCRMENRI